LNHEKDRAMSVALGGRTLRLDSGEACRTFIKIIHARTTGEEKKWRAHPIIPGF